MFLSIGNLNAQDSIPFKKNEVWVNFFNPGATYKRGLNSKTFLKANLNFNFGKSGGKSKTEGDYYANSDSKSNGGNINKSITLGIEKRFTLSPKITLLHGPDLSYGFTFNKSKYNNDYKNDHNSDGMRKQNIQRFGIGYTLGIIHSFNSFLGLGISWSPSLNYTINKTQESTHYYDNRTSQSERKDNSMDFYLSSPYINVILKF